MKYYKLYKDGKVQGESGLDQGEGWALLPVNPYGKYGAWDGKQWVEDVKAREADEAEDKFNELVDMEIRLMAMESVVEKIKLSE